MVSDGAVAGLADLSAVGVLEFVERQHAARLEAEREVLRAAYQWAVLHHPDRLPPDDRRGRSRARRVGGAGTPLITDHAAAAFGARIQLSPYGARRLIADAVDLQLRLPRLWAGVEAGSVRVGHARHVADATRDLSSEEAAWVDGEVVEVADGRLAWSRFESVVEGKVAAAAPELALAREEAAAKERCARMSRVDRHGMATFTIKADAVTVAGIDAAVSVVAERLKDQLPDADSNDRRVAAVALLVNPASHPATDGDLGASVGPVRPKATVYLHLYADSPIARLEGHGPVTIARMMHLLGEAGARVRITPVIDLPGQAPVDAYEIPTRLREAVHLIHPADVFPFAANTTRNVDLDHAVPYSEGGPTSIGNLGPLTRTHHRVKTHAGWEARHPFPGIVIWRDPYGAHYLIDPTGTRRVTPTTGDDTPTRTDIMVTELLLNYAA
ncbi:HNH endonuclease signature motif containing protein [Nocardioides sp. L-11A]|uniref:HNH endonuclease signature motif containing protein n=1 Tax=Nocardioides sp. L-11A TaxID=3043848 RepID=UPI00249B3B1F|nr:HNH endonuclease signature motif containing protein [Nocardioides sp. L-11A]